MADRELDRRLMERLRRAGAITASRPDVNQIMARAHQRRRRRQIGVTAASVVVVGGLGFGSTQWLSATADTQITAAGAPISGRSPVAGSGPITVSTTTDSTAVPEPAGRREASPQPEAGWRTTTEPPAASTTAPVPAEIADGMGGTVLVDTGRLAHRDTAGKVRAIDLPALEPTTERRVTDVAPMAGRPYLLVTDFTDRPDRALEMAAEKGLAPDDPRASELMYHDLAIHAVDLTTLDVYAVEQRTITERTSPDWIYNGHITIQDDNLMVVRELWQSMCVFVEGLTLDGTVIEPAPNPFPQPQLADLGVDTIRAMQEGSIGPPAGCLGFDELTDGAMSVLGTEADPLAIAAVNAELQTAAQATMAALAD